MVSKAMKYLLAFALSAFTSPAFSRMPVEIVSTGDDSVGRRVAFNVKEKIRESTSMTLTFDESEPRLKVYLHTMERDLANPGSGTTFSVVVTWKNPAEPFSFYLTNAAGYCAPYAIKDCAEDIVAGISEESDNIIARFQNSGSR